MMKSRTRILTWTGLVLLGIGLLITFFEVMERRFAEGGIYPHYASFRSDPLGTSAYFETLSELPDYTVSRNVTHLNVVSGLDGDEAFLLLGYPRDDLSSLRVPGDSPVMEAVSEGARLVITINPELVPEKFRPAKTEEEEDWFERRRKLREKQLREEREASESEGAAEESDSPEEEEPGTEEPEESEDNELSFEEQMTAMIGPRITDRLGFELEGLEEFERPDEGWELKRGKSITAKRSELVLPSWYSQYRFETSDKAWTAVAKVEDKPVVIERRWGKGTIVLASDSFFVSNEALHREPVPEFLMWLIGDKTEVVFDETIHGTVETGGTMKLIRQYRLQGVFLGMLIFVGLWAWRSGSTLSPGSEELDRGLVSTVSDGAVMGEETGFGLIQLLRKSIPHKTLLEHCVELWRSSSQRELPAAQEKAVDAIVARHRDDPKHHGAVEAVREITEVLRRR